MSFTNQHLVVGDTADFILYPQLNGAPWDITGGAVNVVLMRPDGVVLPHFNATITRDNNLVVYAHYVVDSTVLSIAGDWKLQFFVFLTPLATTSEELGFPVFPALPVT